MTIEGKGQSLTLFCSAFLQPLNPRLFRLFWTAVTLLLDP